MGNNADIDPKFADAMKDMVYPDGATVVDLGCGFGQYGKHWKFVGTVPSKLTWHGFDGSENIEKATGNEVTFFDLSELRALPLKAPLPAEHYRMSIEVAEHLPRTWKVTSSSTCLAAAGLCPPPSFSRGRSSGKAAMDT